MASPHAAGVAALIVSQFGEMGSNGDVKLSPDSVQSRLQASTIDQGLKGYDECFGHGRINALRAVTERHVEGLRRLGAVLPGVPGVR